MIQIQELTKHYASGTANNGEKNVRKK